MKQSTIEKLQNLAVSMQLVTVEDMQKHSIPQLVTMIANKMNELIQEVYRFEGDVSDVVKTQNDNIQYLLGEGLHLEVATVFENWMNDGTFDTLINHSALKKVNERIDETNTQLSHKVNAQDLHYVNVKTPPIPFVGAKGDGIADDTEAIQNLINNFENILIPCGTFLVSSINLTPKKTLFGLGKHSSILKGNAPGVDVIRCEMDATGYEQCQIHDLTIDGNKVAKCGIYMNRNTTSIHDTWANVYNVFVKNCTEDGIYIGSQIRECYFNEIEIRDCGGHGFNIDSGATDNVLTNIVSHNNEKSGFMVNGANNRFVSCKAYWNGRNNNANQNDRYSGFYITSWTNKFTCCDAQENALHGFHVKDTHTIQLDCITADRNGLPLTDWSNASPQTTYGSGVYIDNSRLIDVTGISRDFMKWSHGQTQKYGITVVKSSSAIEINLMTHDIEQDFNIDTSTSNYTLKINGVEYFHSRKMLSKNNKINYFNLADESGRMGIDIFSNKSQFQVYSNNNDEIKIDTFNKNANGAFQWTGTPLKIKNNGDIHLGRHNTKIGFFDVEGINRIQAPTAASDLATVVTLANELRQILINYGLLG